MCITSSGPEYNPRIDFTVRSDVWYNLKSEVNGSHVRIYVNDKLVKEITMLGSGADTKSDNYVGLWCHSKHPIKGDSFQVQGNASFLCYDTMTRKIEHLDFPFILFFIAFYFFKVFDLGSIRSFHTSGGHNGLESVVAKSTFQCLPTQAHVLRRPFEFTSETLPSHARRRLTLA